MNKKILIINANYYKKICQYLLDGALDYLKKNSDYEYDIIEIPGAFEIPGVLNLAIQSGKYDGFILLGCVIKGETEHYNFICQAIMDSVLSLINQYKISCGMGILTVNNEVQAMDRADKKKKNNGGHAAMTCLKMIEIKKLFPTE